MKLTGIFLVDAGLYVSNIMNDYNRLEAHFIQEHGPEVENTEDVQQLRERVRAFERFLTNAMEGPGDRPGPVGLMVCACPTCEVYERRNGKPPAFCAGCGRGK